MAKESVIGSSVLDSVESGLSRVSSVTFEDEGNYDLGRSGEPNRRPSSRSKRKDYAQKDLAQNDFSRNAWPENGEGEVGDAGGDAEKSMDGPTKPKKEEGNARSDPHQTHNKFCPRDEYLHCSRQKATSSGKLPC